jgi:mono/diheme cytochrome c family protein
MRRLLPALALLLALVALVAAGCGGGEETGATPETVVGEVPTDTGGGEDLPALELEGDAANGKTVYTSAGCGGCHVLADAGSNGAVGPNLDTSKPSYELTVNRVTLGRGGMPPFAGQLSDQEIADVAEYVSTAAGG